MEHDREDRNLPAEVRRGLAGIATEVLGTAIEVAASIVAAAVGLAALLGRAWQAAGSTRALPRSAGRVPAPGDTGRDRPATIDVAPAARLPAAPAAPTKPPGPPAHARATESAVRYRGSRVVAVARDPETVFAWWEVDPDARERAARELVADEETESGSGTATEVLSIAAVAGDGSVDRREIPVPPGSSSRWAPLAQGTRRVEITLQLAAGARRSLLAGPALVRLPSTGISPDTSVRWRDLGGAPAATAGLHIPSPAEVERVWRDLLLLDGESRPGSSGELQPARSALRGLLEGAANPVGSS